MVAGITNSSWDYFLQRPPISQQRPPLTRWRPPCVGAAAAVGWEDSEASGRAWVLGCDPVAAEAAPGEPVSSVLPGTPEGLSLVQRVAARHPANSSAFTKVRRCGVKHSDPPHRRIHRRRTPLPPSRDGNKSRRWPKHRRRARRWPTTGVASCAAPTRTPRQLARRGRTHRRRLPAFTQGNCSGERMVRHRRRQPGARPRPKSAASTATRLSGMVIGGVALASLVLLGPFTISRVDDTQSIVRLRSIPKKKGREVRVHMDTAS